MELVPPLWPLLLRPGDAYLLSSRVQAMSRARVQAGDRWVDSMAEELMDGRYQPDRKWMKVCGTNYNTLICILAVSAKTSPETIKKRAKELILELGDTLLKESRQPP